MFVPKSWLAVLAGFAFLLSTIPTHAIVVAGANGGGNNNTTQEDLETSLAIANGDFFQNVFRYSNASGVYLGYAVTDSGLRAYALTATHIVPEASSVVIGGVTFNVITQVQIDNSDVSLLTLSQEFDIMPSIPALSLSSSTPTPGTQVVMIGYGTDRVQPSTTNPFVSDAVALPGGGTGYTTTGTTSSKHWGTNTTVSISGSNTVPVAISGTTQVAATVFNQPGIGQWESSNEAQAVVGDSGGGVFSYNGTLLGLMVTVSGTDPYIAPFGQATYFSDISLYRNSIQEEIGHELVPEPSTYVLCVLAGLGFFLIRRAQRKQAVPAVVRNVRRLQNARDNYDPSRSRR